MAQVLEELRATEADCGRDEAKEWARELVQEAVKQEQQHLEEKLKSINETVELQGLIKALHNARCRGWAAGADRANQLIQQVIKASPGGKEEAHDLAKSLKLAMDFGETSVLELLEQAWHQMVQRADESRDAITLLVAAVEASSLMLSSSSARARTALERLVVHWREQGAIATGIQNFKLTKETATRLKSGAGTLQALCLTLEKLGEVEARWQAISDAGLQTLHPDELVALHTSASEGQHSFVSRKVEVAMQGRIEQLARSQSSEQIRSFKEALEKVPEARLELFRIQINSLSKMEEKFHGVLGGKDFEAMIRACKEASKLGCEGYAKILREDLKKQVTKQDKRVETNCMVLRIIYNCSKGEGLDDIADLVVMVLGGTVPEAWEREDVHSLRVRKEPVRDEKLISRIQEMVDATYRGFGKGGTQTWTKDRRCGFARRLKVEEVVHVANAENYIHYAGRREQIAQEFKNAKDPPEGRPRNPGQRRNDWDIKTTRVSLKDTIFHPEEPLDLSINECWLWHGTGPEGAEGIMSSHFDLKRAGSATGLMFGPGLYFAESCQKSDEYTRPNERDWYPLLLSRVVCGSAWHCWRKSPFYEMDQFIKACTAGGGFHSVIGDREAAKGTFREFIVFDTDQVYPEYLVWYSKEGPFTER